MSVIERTQAIRSIHVYEHRSVDFKPEPVNDVIELSDFLGRNVSTPWIALFGLSGVLDDGRFVRKSTNGRRLFDKDYPPQIITPPRSDSSLVVVTNTNHGLDQDGIRTELLVLEDGLGTQLS